MSYDREETPEALSQKYSPDSLGRQGSNYLETRVSLKEILCETEEAVMREYKRMYGSTRQIAEVLGISQSSVVRKLHQYGLESSDS
jgi:TyrR family helix-turn-helix protein